MSLPSPLLAVPSLANDQLSFQGVTLGGSNTPFGITQVEGLDKPDVRSGNTDRPRARGAFVGLNLLKSRTVTVTFDVGPFSAGFGSYGNLAGALSALRAACSTEGTTEYPLWMQVPNFPLVAGMARVLKKNIKWDVTADLGNLVRDAVIQFELTDPYLYAAPTLAPSCGLAGPSGGFSFPLSFNLSFGGAQTPNSIVVNNVGDVPCWPTLLITGPCLNPSLQNQAIAGNPTLSFNVQMNTGDQMFVDCDMGTIVYFTAGSSVGAPEPNLINPGSTYFPIVPNSNNILFSSQDTGPVAGTLQLWWTSAFDGLF